VDLEGKVYELTLCSFVWITLFVCICTYGFVATRLFFSADMHGFAGTDLRDPFHIPSSLICPDLSVL